MSDVWLLSEAQMRRIEPFFPLSHGVPRANDWRVISGIIFVLENGLRWRDAPPASGPHKTRHTTGSSAGAAWPCSTGSSPSWRPRAASRTG
ncbi:transposase [Thermaurantiacus tibetensis]